MTDAEIRALIEKARAATPGRRYPWCDHEASLDWLCNDKDHVALVTLDADGRPASYLADFSVARTDAEAINYTTRPADKAQVVADIEYLASMDTGTTIALAQEVLKLRAILLDMAPAVAVLARAREVAKEIREVLLNAEKQILTHLKGTQ